MVGLRTEFYFTLPKGYVADDGSLHREGKMRLATARDEIEPLRDPTIDGPDDPYLTVLVLSRVVTEIGALTDISRSVIEGLFAADLAFLQDLYGIINFGDPADVAALQASVQTAELVVDEPAAASAVDDSEGDSAMDADSADAESVDASAPQRRSGARAHIEEVAH